MSNKQAPAHRKRDPMHGAGDGIPGQLTPIETFRCVDCKRDIPIHLLASERPYGSDDPVCVMCMSYWDYLMEPYPAENTCPACDGWKEEGFRYCDDCAGRSDLPSG